MRSSNRGRCRASSGRHVVDLVDAQQRRVLLVAGLRARRALDEVALAQREAAHLRRRDVDVVGPGEVAGRAQEPVALVAQVEQALAPRSGSPDRLHAGAAPHPRRRGGCGPARRRRRRGVAVAERVAIVVVVLERHDLGAVAAGRRRGGHHLALGSLDALGPLRVLGPRAVAGRGRVGGGLVGGLRRTARAVPARRGPAGSRGDLGLGRTGRRDRVLLGGEGLDGLGLDLGRPGRAHRARPGLGRCRAAASPLSPAVPTVASRIASTRSALRMRVGAFTPTAPAMACSSSRSLPSSIERSSSVVLIHGSWCSCSLRHRPGRDGGRRHAIGQWPRSGLPVRTIRRGFGCTPDGGE